MTVVLGANLRITCSDFVFAVAIYFNDSLIYVLISINIILLNLKNNKNL